jgi:hypothetical protein
MKHKLAQQNVKQVDQPIALDQLRHQRQSVKRNRHVDDGDEYYSDINEYINDDQSRLLEKKSGLIMTPMEIEKNQKKQNSKRNLFQQDGGQR